ncbi:MAG: chemotaxis response regulator protein-glutamate methylesterase [Dehalococcoidia bacterium]
MTLTPPLASGKKIRAVLVDDSATIRSVLRRKLEADGSIEVVGTASDGLEALDLIARARPDVVTLDIEMPRLDGLSTLQRLMETQPTPVVMVSGLTREGADATIRALELGAVDFIEKPALATGVGAVADDLIAKVRHAARARLQAPMVAPAAPRSPIFRPAFNERWRKRIVVIGASTGGPQAVRRVLTALPAGMRVPVVVVQHMPAGFTRSLADRLNDLGPLRVREAEAGMALTPGEVLLAPGGYHLVFDRQGVASLTQEPPEMGVRPAINVTMASIAQIPMANPVAVILTGMGSDGTRGAGLIKQAGGYVISEAEATCVVYGMPRAVFEAGHSDEVLPLDAVADGIARQVREIAARSA